MLNPRKSIVLANGQNDIVTGNGNLTNGHLVNNAAILDLVFNLLKKHTGQTAILEDLQQEVIDYLEFTGTTHAVEEVEVRARVAGFLESMHFTPGTIVEKDALLFVTDPRQYRAELNAARAELESARAKFKRAETEFTRAQRIFKQGAGSDADVVKWRGEREIARAAVLRAKAQVDQAQLKMDYTQVTAPITGRVSRNYVDIGNLVGEKEPTLLTTVIRMIPCMPISTSTNGTCSR